MKILIAEDNADDRKLLRITLEHYGYEVIEASDGLEGLELARTQEPDLIISDALMPGMDGYLFLRTLKKDKKLQGIPFIFYSAVYTGDEEAALALSLGAEAFIEKPKDIQELWIELNTVLKKIGKENQKTLSSELIEKEDEFLKKYANIVTVALEAKVMELNREIKEHRQTEKELIQKELFLNNIIDSVQDGISILDKNLNIIRVNTSIEKWYADQMPIAGKKCYEVYHSRKEPCEICPSIRTLKTGWPDSEVIPFEVKGQQKGWQRGLQRDFKDNAFCKGDFYKWLYC